MHLIRFPNRKEHKRGLMALLEIPHEFVGLPDHQMTAEHIKALQHARITFEFLSKTAAIGNSSAV